MAKATFPGMRTRGWGRIVNVVSVNGQGGQIPIGRLGQPDEIARVVEILTSENKSFITGSTLSINSRQHMY